MILAEPVRLRTVHPGVTNDQVRQGPQPLQPTRVKAKTILQCVALTALRKGGREELRAHDKMPVQDYRSVVHSDSAERVCKLVSLEPYRSTNAGCYWPVLYLNIVFHARTRSFCPM
jgi:hypothetical protein